MVKLRIELVKSIIGRKPNHIATVKSLGLKKMNDVVEHVETPVPNSISTYSSAITGISLPTNGSINFLPTKCLYLSSSGCTATATSASIVSGLDVAIIIYSSESFTGYFK